MVKITLLGMTVWILGSTFILPMVYTSSESSAPSLLRSSIIRSVAANKASLRIAIGVVPA
ncbi:hypothetical protein D3C73_1530080 [compost metagenome]